MATVTPLGQTELRDAKKALMRELVTGTDDARIAYATQLASWARRHLLAGVAFKEWSFANRSFLSGQARARGEAHRVIGLWAGKAQWTATGRQVKDGAAPYFIYRPVMVTPDSDQDGEASEGQTPKPRFVGRFSTVEVFDYHQTVAVDPNFTEPDWSRPLVAGDASTLLALAGAVRGGAMNVTFERFGGDAAHGRTDGTTIVVDADLAVADQIATVAHEAVHVELDHPARLAASPAAEREALRATFEAEAALGEYLLLKVLGLDESVGNAVTANAAAYLRSWEDANGEGHKARFAALNARLSPSLAAAQAIAGRVGRPAGS